MKRILLSTPHIGNLELQYVRDVFESNWLSTVGPQLTAFEADMENRLGVPAVSVSSGTAAIHLGLRLLGVGPGDDVFCQTLTFVATANPIAYLGARPVFIDSEPVSWSIDPELLRCQLHARAKMNRLPKAVVVVHLFGQSADMDPLLEACGRYEVPILEDAAEALGTMYKGSPAGTLGQIGTLSFNGNKIITTAGGGMVVSKNRQWIEKARFWAYQAKEPGRAYEHLEAGYNYGMSNVLAAIGRGQLRMLDLRVTQRRAIAFRYKEAFADLRGITMMPDAGYGLHTHWLSCFLIDPAVFGCSRDHLIGLLDAAGIESRTLFKPLHRQPLFFSCPYYGQGVADDLYARGICLPSSSNLSYDDQLYVVNQIRRIAGAPLLQGFAEELAIAGPS